ncbi:MAG: carboxypeptidase-like regulatory domain-containing protein [Acidobacteriota bacterium]
MRWIVRSVSITALLAMSALFTSAEEQARLTVTVVDAKQQAISGVRLSCWIKQDDAWWRQSDAATNREGQAEIVAPAPPYTLLAARAGWVPQRIDIVQKRSDLRLVMDPGRRLEVSAVAASSNTPVTSFRAIALSGEAAAATASTQAFEMETADSVESDAETAVATIIGIGNRTRMLLVLAAGYAPAIVPVPPANVAHVEAKLDARGCQEYRVVDSAGSPVSGARAALDGNLLGAWGSRLSLVPQSGSDGYLTLCRPSSSTAPAIVAHPQFAPRQWNWDSADSSIALAEGGTLAGAVMDADGLPLQGATVTVKTYGLEHTARVAADGSYQLQHLPAGEWTTRLTDTRLPGGRGSTVRIVDNHLTRLDFGPGRARAVLIFENEQPVDHGTVLLLSGSKSSELIIAGQAEVENGRASVPVSELEPLTLLSLRRADTVVFKKINLDKNAQPDQVLDVRLDGTTISGVVRSATTHQPLKGAQLICQRGVHLSLLGQRGPLWFDGLAAQPFFNGDASLAVTGRDGRFRMFLPDWCSTLQVGGPRAVAPEDEPWQARLLSTKELDRSAPLEVELTRAASMLARVVVDAGVTARDVMIALRRTDLPSNSLTRSMILNETARIEIPDRGPWWLIATAEGAAPALFGPLSGEPAGAAASLEPIELRLEAGAYLELPSTGDVKILDRTGFDWAGLVGSQPMGDRLRRLGPIPRGTYRVSLGEHSKSITLREAGQVLRPLAD